ncbi:hypothetical protein MD484_g3473, partial [Candolleomyces efflorescens]
MLLLDCPMYWTKIMLGGAAQKELLKQMIIRARGLPLDVKVYLDPYFASRDVTNIDYVWEEAAKIRSLAIAGNHLQTLFACRRRCKTVIDAPLLERLTLKSSLKDPWGPPNNIFIMAAYQIKAPKLEFASFSHILPQYSFFPSTIQQLHLRADASLGEGLLAELPRFVRLKSLALQCRFVRVPPTAQLIHLPHLKELILHTNTEPLLYLLTKMEVHPQCTFDLCLVPSQLDLPHDLSKVIGEKAKGVLQSHPLEEPSIDLELWKEGKVTLRLLTSSTHASPPHLTVSVHTNLRHPTPHDKAMIFSSVLEEIPPVNKMMLRVFGSVEGSLVHILSKSPMLTITDLTLYDPQPYLWTEICTFERSRPTYIPLPSLHVLRIVGQTETMYRIKGDKRAGLTGIKQLLATAEHRSTSTASSPLKVIDIRDLDSQDPLYAALKNAEPTLKKLGVEVQYGT